MTSRVPLFNFVIPFLILFPIPNNLFWDNLGKIFLSAIIFSGIYYSGIKILKCRLRKTKFILILLGILMSFSRTKQEFLAPLNCKSEIIASIDSKGFYQTKRGSIHKTVKINEIQNCKVYWSGKDVIIEDQYGILNNERFINETLTVKGIVYLNHLKLPTFAISKIIENKNQGVLEKISNRKDILIENFWTNSKASSYTKSFIIAFTTGEKIYIDNSLKKTYINTGVMHLFAVSGLHFGILYLVLIFISFFITNNKLFISFSVISILFFYLAFIGFTYSAQRAFLMILIWEISNLFLRRKCAVSALSFSFVITTLIQPESLYEPGFQLSFTIVLLIIWFSKGTIVLRERKSFLAYFLGFVKCSLAAFCGSFFILLGTFGQIVPVSIISNIILVPFALPLMVIFIVYLINYYLFNIDLYFFVDFIYTVIIELLLFLNNLPLSYFSVEFQVNPYIYIILPIFVLLLFNKRWNFLKKFFFTFIVSLSPVFYITYF